MSKAPSTMNDGKDRTGGPGQPEVSNPKSYDKANEVPAISEKAFVPKPKFNEAERKQDPWKGRGGAFEINEHGERVPLEVPYDPNIPLPPDAPQPPATDEAPQDRTPKS